MKKNYFIILIILKINGSMGNNITLGLKELQSIKSNIQWGGKHCKLNLFIASLVGGIGYFINKYSKNELDNNIIETKEYYMDIHLKKQTLKKKLVTSEKNKHNIFIDSRTFSAWRLHIFSCSLANYEFNNKEKISRYAAVCFLDSLFASFLYLPIICTGLKLFNKELPLKKLFPIVLLANPSFTTIWKSSFYFIFKNKEKLVESTSEVDSTSKVDSTSEVDSTSDKNKKKNQKNQKNMFSSFKNPNSKFFEIIFLCPVFLWFLGAQSEK